MSQGGTTQKLPKIDFLRAVSATSVVLYHFGVPGVNGASGVLTFFVISGFLITHLLLRENERTGSISLKNFYLRRSLRIFPAFYVYWIIAVTDLIVRHRILWGQAICSFLYVNNYYQGLHDYPSSLLSHTWSLGVEEQFYILWPGVFFLFRNSLRKLITILLIFVPCLWVYRSALHYFGVSDPYIYTSLETRIDAILMGCLLAIVLHAGVAQSFFAEVRRPRYLVVVLCLLGVSLWCTAHIPHLFFVTRNNEVNGYRDVFGFAIEPVLVAILISQLIALRGGSWLDSKPISYLGRISYSTYLYQQMVIPALKTRLPASLSLVGCLAAIWLISAMSYEMIEKPFLKLKDRFATINVGKEPETPTTDPSLEAPPAVS